MLFCLLHRHSFSVSFLSLLSISFSLYFFLPFSFRFDGFSSFRCACRRASKTWNSWCLAPIALALLHPNFNFKFEKGESFKPTNYQREKNQLNSRNHTFRKNYFCLCRVSLKSSKMPMFRSGSQKSTLSMMRQKTTKYQKFLNVSNVLLVITSTLIIFTAVILIKFYHINKLDFWSPYFTVVPTYTITLGVYTFLTWYNQLKTDLFNAFYSFN